MYIIIIAIQRFAHKFGGNQSYKTKIAQYCYKHQMNLPRKQKETASQFALSALIYKQKSCERCSRKHNEASMMLCDRCEDAYHIRCINIPSVPKDAWICSPCQIDSAKLKQQQLMRKRPTGTNHTDQCRACKNKRKDSFDFEMGQSKIAFSVNQINLVQCAYCEQQFHNLCFSQRPNSINCRQCEEAIRQSIPKGHANFIAFMKQSQMKVTLKNYIELSNKYCCPQADYCLPHYDLVPPQKLKNWRLLVSYEASLCYALCTRQMIYCQNLVIEKPQQNLENVIRAHKNSVQKIYKLHKKDELAYQQFKKGLQFGCMPPLQVKEDRKKGFYLVSTAFIAKKTILAEYAGELITARESLNMISNDNIFTLIRNPRSVESLDIGPSQFANIAIFISGLNNSQKDASSLENVRALKFSYRGITRLIFTALKDIQPKETLFLNYNGDRAISQYPTEGFVHG